MADGTARLPDLEWCIFRDGHRGGICFDPPIYEVFDLVAPEVARPACVRHAARTRERMATGLTPMEYGVRDLTDAGREAFQQ